MNFECFRKLAELQVALSDSTQKVGKLSETIDRQREEVERETEVLLVKHQEDLKSAQERYDDAVCILHLSHP